MGTRYKVTKQQLEMVVESFVKENKKTMNETEMVDEGLLDLPKNFIKAVKDAVAKIKPMIAKMAKEDPQVMADLKGAAKDMGEDEVAELGVDVNEVYESILGEGKELINEVSFKKMVGNLLQALGLGGIVASIPGFMSQITGWSDWTWTTKLHNTLQPFCDTLPPKMCGPLFLLAIGISIVLLIKGAIVKSKA